LENTKTLADSKITFSDIPGAITMHVVVQPPIAKKKTGLFNLLIYAFAEVVWLRVPLSGYRNNILIVIISNWHNEINTIS
jgi:hypothetical protein